MDASAVLAHLRKESLDLYNRLHSIEHDVAFVVQVHHAYPKLPVVANLRCGAWYTDPDIASSTPAYFKSTDGHFNHWSFNLRRPNLHLIPLIQQHNGMIVVDSTRSGKRIPDALSKTVPIWCAVINRALRLRYNDLFAEWDTSLFTPPGVVSMSEHHQIDVYLDLWAESLHSSSYDLPRLQKPLRPLWVTPATSVFPTPSTVFLPVICVSASRQVSDGIERRGNGFSYVQGSGDDHELWGEGLTPAIFWNSRERILHAPRSELPDLIKSLVLSVTTSGVRYEPNGAHHCTPINKIGGRIMLSTLSDLHIADMCTNNDLVYVLLEDEHNTCVIPESDHIYRFTIRSGKRGQAEFLQTILPSSIPVMKRTLQDGWNVCIACASGRDFSVGLALAATQLLFDDEGCFSPDTQMTCDKTSIRIRLQWIISSRPEANPSRATLQRVNQFLLSPPEFWRTP